MPAIVQKMQKNIKKHKKYKNSIANGWLMNFHAQSGVGSLKN